jgi:proteasome accessory factor C
MSGRRGPQPLKDRMRRLLVMLPWLMERGSATLAEMCERFQVSERDLVSDLEQAAMCGLPPYLDEVVDLFIDEGVAYVGVPRFFTRPLRLTAPEGFTLITAGRAALALPGPALAQLLGAYPLLARTAVGSALLPTLYQLSE